LRVPHTLIIHCRDLATLVIEAHGGLDRWNDITSIEVSFNLSGAALTKKLGLEAHYRPRFIIDTKDVKTVMEGLAQGSRTDRLVYTLDRVWIEGSDGKAKASRNKPYKAFSDHTRDTPWDDLHLACFGGYAFHNYLTFPFHLSWEGFSSREIAPHEENGETWRVLEVTHPDHYDAHSKVQWYYFDKDFMLRRLDYAPLAFKVPVAHYCFDAKDFDGIKIPTFRRVVWRHPDTAPVDGVFPLGGNAMLSGPTSFLIDYCQVIVHRETGDIPECPIA
jgi:hypothetical protein